MVTAQVVVDGHEIVRGRVLHRPVGATEWSSEDLAPLPNDEFRATIRPERLGRHEFLVEAWIDRYAGWLRGLERKLDAEEPVDVDLLVGARLLEARTAGIDAPADRALVSQAAHVLADPTRPFPERIAATRAPDLLAALERNPDRSGGTRQRRALPLQVDPPLARCSAWYEFFPRSCGAPGEHGTFRDAERMLRHAARLGFDIVYLPPIHPIGRAHRKGPDNALEAGPDDPGSPWAIGAAEGGHKSVHPELGTLEDFDSFVERAGEFGLQVALDIALQCAPDHPYVTEHPEWFQKRPDGSIQYAENPPKKYQDICPFDFECADWKALWVELASIFEFWCERGIRVFRVDNPHTKPVDFWEWCIARVRERWPDTIFLAEAFTRPKMMHRLAKLGFSQSYTYFTWRRFKDELESYVTELTTSDSRDFFRPNFWPNTPDILPDDLWDAPRGAFLTRVTLAATLSANYGIYGPAFELLDNRGRPGSGEYRDNEKYQIKDWDLDRADSIAPFLKRLNRIRAEHPALRFTDNVRFHATDNDMLLCYSKTSPDGNDLIVVVANLDYHHVQSGRVDVWFDDDVPLVGERFQAHDLLSDTRFDWRVGWNYVSLDPNTMPVHILHVRRFVRREQDFDYFA